jgi:hypothetical protein
VTATAARTAPPPPAPPRPGRGSRWAWRVVGSAVAILVVAWAGLQAVELLAHDQETVTTTLAAGGVAVLQVDNDAGSVRVVGTDRDEVVVTARVSHGLRSPDHAARQDGDTAVVTADCPVMFSGWCDVDFVIEVPRAARIVVEADDRVVTRGTTGPVEASSDDGGIDVESATGVLDLRSDNGRIVARDVRATEVHARSDNGDVEVELGVAPDVVDAESDNGDVEVVVPDGTGPYAVSSSTDNGSASTDVRTDPDAARRVRIVSDNGDVTVRYRTP